MLIIAHRGNIGGADPAVENHPKQVDRCISGYTWNVEVDVWRDNGGRWWLGHDEPQYEVDIGWLYTRSNFLWIHCKNDDALCFLQNNPMSSEFNYFWHESDDFTITSNGYVWAYPGKNVRKPCRAIAVMPELTSNLSLSNFRGVCTDDPGRYV